jgi:hypothetical protein
MILAKGKYDKPPKWSWTLQVALAFLVFAPAVVLLGTIPLPVIIMGLIAVALVALAIVLTDKILAKGQYKKYPPIKWTLSTVAALAPFALGMAFLGPLIIPVALGAVAVLIVAAVAASVVAIGLPSSPITWLAPGIGLTSIVSSTGLTGCNFSLALA